jgi:hypothetical protein
LKVYCICRDGIPLASPVPTESLLRRNLKINSKTVKDRANEALVRPKLEYCCTVWDPYASENIYSLKKHNTSSVTDMMHALSWPTLQEHRILTRLQMFHKIVNNKIEIPHKNILI